LVIHRAWTKLGGKLPVWLAWFITFNFINIAWIFFRAKEWDDAWKVLSSMFHYNFNIEPNLLQLYWVMSTLLLILLFKNTQEIITKNYNRYFISFSSNLLFFVALLQLTNIFIQNDKISEFLYFNF